jgi:hypothetical protein
LRLKDFPEEFRPEISPGFERFLIVRFPRSRAFCAHLCCHSARPHNMTSYFQNSRELGFTSKLLLNCCSC